ncbi:MAG: amidohydrolase [Anaerolineae bacterium]|nr:amidohydrolase [Anaerolineae bacterium]MCI0608894.1 amidohydrolase [Anaerolineae bacterium]
MTKGKNSRRSETHGEKIIYNSHIHTFTVRNTPILFPLLFFPDSITGKLSIKRTLFIITVSSLIVLVVAVTSFLLSVVFGKLIQFFQIPFPEMQQWIVTYFTQTPSLAILPADTPYRSWIDTPLLIIKDSLTLMIVWILLERAGNLIARTIKWLFRIWKAENPNRQLFSEFISFRRDVDRLTKPLRKNPMLNFIGKLNPAPNDVLERYSRFLNTALLGSQSNVFTEVQLQYPKGTKFVVLPMNLEHMGRLLGWVPRKIDHQHDELLQLAKCFNGAEEKDKVIYPFYTIHPEQKNLADVISKMKSGLIFGKDKFRGLKIYPNLGYKPNDKRLKDVYVVCEKQNVPVMTHCTPTGIWKFGLSESQRRGFAHPENYEEILTTHKNLRVCLAHFGGAEEWVHRLQKPEDKTAWVRVIYEMIDGGKYKNLYTDISYTIFEPKVKGLTIDLIDYLKVMLESSKNVREHVLFGSDYYMIEQEKVTEKEVGILLRSRLGDDLFFQIAYTNPRKFLGIIGIR